MVCRTFSLTHHFSVCNIFLCRNYELVAFSVNIDNLYIGICTQMFAQFRDVNVHTAGIEIIVVHPDCLKCEIALKNFVCVFAKKLQQVALFGCKLRGSVVNFKRLLLCVKEELADLEIGLLGILLSVYTAQDSFDTEHELFHRERFGNVIVAANLEAVENISLESFGSKEDNGHFRINLSYFLGKGEAVFLWHHYVKHADVEFAFHE